MKMLNKELEMKVEKCVTTFEVNMQMEVVRENIIYNNHDYVVDLVVDELELDDWDGGLESAPRHVTGKYNSFMDDLIEDDMDTMLEQHITEHIKLLFDDAILAEFPELTDHLTKSLWIKIKRARVELNYADLELIGMLYSHELPDLPFHYHQSMMLTDEKYKQFIQDNYFEIVTAREQLLKQYRVENFSSIPNVLEIVREGWGSK